MNIELTVRTVGKKWVITSPEVPELYVVGVSEAEARDQVPSALAMLGRIKGRQAAKRTIQQKTGGQVAA